MLFNEPKLLKYVFVFEFEVRDFGFSALQRAEIAEIGLLLGAGVRSVGFSALQRAEIAEMRLQHRCNFARASFSALQRAEIAEILQNEDRYSIGRTFQCSSTSRNC